MATPKGCTVTFLGFKFDAFAVHFGLKHPVKLDPGFPPLAGRPFADFRFYADMHDTANMPYEMLSKFIQACVSVSSADSKGEAKVELWQDENQQNAIITFSFDAWMAEASFGSIIPSDAVRVSEAKTAVNHVFFMRLEPIVDAEHGINIVTGN